VRPLFYILVFVGLLLGLALAINPGYDRQLEGAEIRALLADAHVEGHHDLHDYDFDRTYRADGTFQQARRGAAEVELADWSIQGDEVCIQWETGDTRLLCRTVHTDDRGAYWKVMVKRNGHHKRVLTYTAFEDVATGADRRVFVDGREYALRWLVRPKGLTVLAVLAVTLLLTAHALLRDPELPTSLRSRIRRRFPFELDGRSLRYSQLPKLSREALDGVARSAMAHGEYMMLTWAYEAMLFQGDEEDSWRRIWSVIGDASDRDASDALRVLLLVGPDAETLLSLVGDDPRALGLCARHVHHDPGFSDGLKALPAEALDNFTALCITRGDNDIIGAAIRALVQQTDDFAAAWRRLWPMLEPLEDERLSPVLLALINAGVKHTEILAVVEGNPRIMYLLGLAYSALAEGVHRSSESLFDAHKEASLAFLSPLRDYKGAAADAAYLGMVGAAFEKMMYMQYQPRTKKGGSSSYAGGG
jgi:hypothetical protein